MSDLYFSDLSRWNPTQRIDEVLYPPNISDLFSDEQLEAIGLYRPADADLIPEGKQVVSTSVQWINGVLKYVHTLEDIPIVFPKLTSRQLWTALAITGHYDDVDTAIAGLELVARIEAQKATSFERDHPLIAQLSPILGLTEEQIDDLWLWASTL